MNLTLKHWSRRLAWALPMFALLAGCDAGKDAGKDETIKPHAVGHLRECPLGGLAERVRRRPTGRF